MDIIITIREISLLIGILIAIYSIDSWRREHTGKRRIELAEETLASFYQARDAISHIRYPGASESETADLKRGESESDNDFEARKRASIAFSRYNKYQELFSRLHSLRYQFMARIGTEEAKPFDDLRSIVNEILGSARLLARLWARDHFRTDQQWENDLKYIEKYERVFREGMSEEDPINPRADRVIENIETVCKGIITGQGTLHHFLNKPLWKRGKRN